MLVILYSRKRASGKLASAAEYKKGELVKTLTKFFQTAKKAKKPTESDHKVNGWLPEAMNFPAIDPDHRDAMTEESYFDDELSEEEEDSA